MKLKYTLLTLALLFVKHQAHAVSSTEKALQVCDKMAQYQVQSAAECVGIVLKGTYDDSLLKVAFELTQLNQSNVLDLLKNANKSQSIDNQKMNDCVEEAQKNPKYSSSSILNCAKKSLIPTLIKNLKPEANVNILWVDMNGFCGEVAKFDIKQAKRCYAISGLEYTPIDKNALELAKVVNTYSQSYAVTLIAQSKNHYYSTKALDICKKIAPTDTEMSATLTCLKNSEFAI